MNKEELKQKFNDFKLKAKWRLNRLEDWVVEHPEMVLGAAVAVIPGVVKVSKNISRARVESLEQKRRDTDWYDPAVGKHITTRRKLTPAEIAEVAERNANGERVSTILYSMGLIAR